MDIHRQLGALISVVLILIGLAFIALSVWFALGKGAVIAVGLGTFGVVCTSYGADMAYRAVTGVVTPATFFAGRLGAFRAVVGLLACTGLALLAVAIVVLDVKGGLGANADSSTRIAVVALFGLAVPTALACLRALRRSPG